jgi:acyl-lipid omega-6 desaturase (Delta-12 desaturase)
MTQANDAPPVNDAKSLFRQISVHARPNHWRSVVELVITAAPLAALFAGTWLAVQNGHWIGLLLTIPAAALLVRLFMIQHDCAHGSFFRGRTANDWVGRIIGVLTLTPYDYWRRSHALHHARHGHLDHRGMGDVAVLTTREYRDLSRWKRFFYRLYRNPLILFGLGPAFLFGLQFRVPLGLMGKGKPWLSTMATNLALGGIVVALVFLGGFLTFLLIYLPIMLMAATAGVWLFYVQHQFEQSHWAAEGEWTFHEAALHGSSYYDLPPFLRWLSANIGIHHIHHLASRIPFYRLPRVLREWPELRGVGRLTLRQSFATVKLKLWDEDKGRMVGFREARVRAG